MHEKERGRKTSNSSNCSEGLVRGNSSLHCSHPTFPYLLRFPAFSPSLLHRRPRDRTAATSPGSGLWAAEPQTPGGGSAACGRPSRGGAGRGWKRSQSAGEAKAGPRLASPVASNLRCPSWSFEPLHPLVALSLLQPPGPKRWPGRTGVRRKKTHVPPLFTQHKV